MRQLSCLALALLVGAFLGCRSPSPGGASAAPRPAEPAPQAPVQAPAPVLAPGSRPSAPLPGDGVVELSAIRLAVLGVERGDDAAARLRAAGAAHAIRQGWEPLRVRLRLTGVRDGSWVGCKDFRVTGSSRVAYFHGAFGDAALEARRLPAGQSVEGWCSYAIPVSERDLLLMVNEPDSRDPAGLRYVALEDGAALSDVASPAALPGRALGLSASEWAPLGREVVTQEWSVTALEILRGEPAQALVAQANPGNPAPAPGLEFLAVKLSARYFGRSGEPGLLSASQFQTLSDSGTPYPRPIVLDVKPRLTRTLLPGGEHTGWAVFHVAPEQRRPLLRFTPYYPDEGERFIALAKEPAPGP